MNGINQNTYQPLVSVIVPVYNVEKYLRGCVDSILAQTYDNFEVILVDDGSPDGSGKICDEYVEKYDRVKVIHKKNGGLSDARNVGIDNASGEYVTFVDSDDMISKDMISELMLPIKADVDVEVACCYFENFNDGDFVEFNKIDEDIDCSIISYSELIKKNIWVISCAKVYKKSLFDSLKFPVGRLHEDEFTTYKLCYAAKKIAWTDDKFYFYRRQRDGSITNKKTIKNFQDALDAFAERIAFFEERDEPELAKHTSHEIAALVGTICKECEKREDALLVTREALSLLNKYYSALRMNEKIRLFLCVYLPSIFRLQARIRGKK